MDLQGRYVACGTIIAEAGALALSYFQRRDELLVQSKGTQDFVSQADLQTELLIKKRLADQFPEDAFLGEETGRTEHAAEQGIWVVDPIDGTQPFINGMSSWCISIAFVMSGRVRFGMVYAPARAELFAGGRGFGATLNGAPIHPSQAKSIREGMVSTGYSPKSGPGDFLPAFSRFLEAGGMFHREGSGALSLCYVACGRLIGFYEPLIKSYDCLGAVAVIQGAGGKTSDFLAGDGLWSGSPLIAGNAEVYEELSKLTRWDLPTGE